MYPDIPQLAEDGIFGPLTQRSVIAFQQQFGFTPSGVANQITWNMIMSMRNLLAPGINVATMTADISEVNTEATENPAPAVAVVSENTQPQLEYFGEHEDITPCFMSQQPNPARHHDKIAWILALILLSDM